MCTMRIRYVRAYVCDVKVRLTLAQVLAHGQWKMVTVPFFLFNWEIFLDCLGTHYFLITPLDREKKNKCLLQVISYKAILLLG